MHGRVWIFPLFFLVWFVQFLPPQPWLLPVQGATGTEALSREASPKPTPKKPSSATKARRAKPRSSPIQMGRRSAPSRKNPHVRQYTAQNSLLRRLAAAGLLRGPVFGEPRVLETWRIRPVDGDTFWYGGERIRIRGYDAPEMAQPGGFDAARRLEALLHEGEVRLYPHGLDIYGRTLGDVYVEQRNVAEVMIEEGYVKKR